MRSFPWNSLSGTTTPEGIPLKRLIQSNGESAIFDGEDSTILVVAPQEPAKNVVNRFREAIFFNNPHLVRVRNAGILAPHELVYAVTEPVEHTLSHSISEQPLPEGDAKSLVEHTADGLAYLHSENFVFCNLRPDAVWRAGATWKLGDFSQLRLAGNGDSRELRSALARRLDLPPEVYEGAVLPAWDVWSLGALLRRVLVPEPLPVKGGISTPRGRQLRNGDLPAPFDGIARDCLEPDPNSRITLEQIRGRLEAPPQNHPGLSSRLHGLPPAAKIGLAVFVAALALGIIASEAKMFRPGDKRVQTKPAPIATSEADRQALNARSKPSPIPPSPSVETPAPSPVAIEQASRQIQAVLDKYVKSIKAKDMEANLDLYDLTDAASRERLAGEKKRQFQSFEKVYRYNFDNVKIVEPSPDSALVSFDRHWSFGDLKPYAGAGRDEFELRNIQGAWKITSERELKVYWTRQGRIQPGLSGELHDKIKVPLEP